MSQRSASSSKSQHSNIFSLSSNKSQKEEQQNEWQEFRDKLCQLFNVNECNLSDLFYVIQQKLSDRFLQQKMIEFDKMLSSLSKIKKNNREMTKLISILGIKLENNKQSKSHNQNLKIKGEQKEETELTQTNPTQTSQQYYNFKHKPINSAFSNFFNSQRQRKKVNDVMQYNQKQNVRYLQKQMQQLNKHQQKKVQSSQMKEKQRQKSYYEVYQQKNKTYEQRIKNMLQELGSIKNQLNSSNKIKIADEYLRNQEIKTKQSKNQNFQFINQYSPFQVNKEIVKDSKSTQKSAQSINFKQLNLKNQNQISYTEIKKIQKYKQLQSVIKPKQKILDHVYDQQTSSLTQQCIQKTNTKNMILMQYAKNISKKLSEIKKQASTFQKSKNQPIYYQPFYSDLNLIQTNAKQQCYQKFNISEQKNNKFPQQKVLDQMLQQEIRYIQDQDQQKGSNKSPFQSPICLQKQDKQKQFSQNELSIKKQDSQSDNQVPAPKIGKKKSILDDMKKVQSKVVLSQIQIKHENQGTVIDIVDQNNLNQFQNKSKNLVSHASVRNSFNDAVSQSSGKQVVISYLTMQQPSNKKWQQQNLFQRKNEVFFNSNSNYTGERVSEFSQSGQNERKKSIHKISPSINNLSNNHNTSIMNYRNQFPSFSNNSSTINQKWKSPFIEQQRIKESINSGNSSGIYQNIFNQPYLSTLQKERTVQVVRPILNNSLLTRNQRPQTNRNFINSQTMGSNNNTMRKISFQQIPVILPQHNRGSYILNNSIQLTPIKQPLIIIGKNQSMNINPKTQLVHSTSALNINMNDLQNRFRSIQNKSLSNQRQKIRNNSLLKNTSYIRKENILNEKTGNSSFNLTNRQKAANIQNVSFFQNLPQKKSLTNPFDQLREENQNKNKDFRVSFKNQLLQNRSRQYFTGLNMVNSSSSSKVQPFVTLGNSSKISRDSRDSRDSKGSRKSQSKGIHLISPSI